MKLNIKTVNRLFTVLGVIVSVLIIQFAVTPLTFAVNVDSNIYKLPVDNSFPTLYSYFFGNNTGIVDFLYNSKWYRHVINNNFVKVNIDTETISNRTHYILKFQVNNTETVGYNIYQYVIGNSYSSSSGFSSSSWYAVYSNNYDLGTDYPYINSCAAPVDVQLTSTQQQHCDFNSFYPLVTVSGSGSVDLTPVLNGQTTIKDNQSTIISKVDKVSSQLDQLYGQSVRQSINESSIEASRDERQRSEANSRQSQIMEAGSDLTVSTIDNWVAGENGLAAKLTNLAATLSSNADIFSQNQSENQANLQKAGDFVKGVFDQIPTGIIAACLCFLIMLIAVKVVGR